MIIKSLVSSVPLITHVSHLFLQWHHALSWPEATRFMLSVQFSCTLTLLSLNKHGVALDQFLELKRYRLIYPFAAAHLYAAVCFMKLNR